MSQLLKLVHAIFILGTLHLISAAPTREKARNINKRSLNVGHCSPAQKQTITDGLTDVKSAAKSTTDRLQRLLHLLQSNTPRTGIVAEDRSTLQTFETIFGTVLHDSSDSGASMKNTIGKARVATIKARAEKVTSTLGSSAEPQLFYYCSEEFFEETCDGIWDQRPAHEGGQRYVDVSPTCAQDSRLNGYTWNVNGGNQDYTVLCPGKWASWSNNRLLSIQDRSLLGTSLDDISKRYVALTMMHELLHSDGIFKNNVAEDETAPGGIKAFKWEGIRALATSVRAGNAPRNAESVAYFMIGKV
ncbi:hypothetical protein N7512_005507 [Penicillium capsulatum]|nr:hypothetical protein N7512_005507 [Penicillium capsulatum]